MEHWVIRCQNVATLTNYFVLHLFAMYVHVPQKLYIHLEIQALHTRVQVKWQFYKLYRWK